MCKYCEGKNPEWIYNREDAYFSKPSFRCDLAIQEDDEGNNKVLSVNADGGMWIKLINFCPMCGRDLKDTKSGEAIINMVKEANKNHKDYAICKCGQEQINTSTIDQCNKCKEFFTLKYPNRKTEYNAVVKKYIKE